MNAVAPVEAGGTVAVLGVAFKPKAGDISEVQAPDGTIRPSKAPSQLP
ncbi:MULTISPECIES: hypothetical protein [unclassified Mesorhizobium]